MNISIDEALADRLTADGALEKLVAIPAWAIPRAMPWMTSDKWSVHGFCHGGELIVGNINHDLAS